MEHYLELLGAGTGIAGALLMAAKCRYSAWAWPVWVISGIAWVLYAGRTDTWGLLAQQVVFTVINIVGLWRWLVQPLMRRMRAVHTETH